MKFFEFIGLDTRSLKKVILLNFNNNSFFTLNLNNPKTDNRKLIVGGAKKRLKENKRSKLLKEKM